MQSSNIYYINSIARTSGTPGNFTFEVQIPNAENYDRVTLLQANIPVSYYLVPQSYNTFQLVENNGVSTTTTTITVFPGNYTANSFISVVAPLINTASPNGWIYSITIPNLFSFTNTGKFTFTVTNNLGHQPSFVLNNMWEMFGFEQNSTNTFVSNILTSKNVIKMIPEDSIMIHSDICDNGENSILQEVFGNNSVAFSNILYQCPDVLSYSRRLRTNQSSSYTFSLTDEHNRPVDLNGVNIIFTIVLFKKDNFTTVFKNYLKMQLSDQQ